ncbi:MAG TPA: PH domain-containing protein [Naasia sp.]
MAAPLELGDGTWHRVSPKQIGVEVTGSVLMALITGAAAVATYLLGLGFVALPLALMFVGSVVTAVLVPRRVRAYGYQLRDDDLLFRRGLLAQRFVSVPYGRMQLIDINRGPISRLLGLSELKFVTAAAATGVVIPGLPEDEAEGLRDRLVGLAESRRVGL